MSRETITLTAPNGARVRTVRSKRFFVVSFHETTMTYNRATGEYDHHAPKPVAEVVKRTDSIAVVDKEYFRSSGTRVAFDIASGEPKVIRGGRGNGIFGRAE